MENKTLRKSSVYIEYFIAKMNFEKYSKDPNSEVSELETELRRILENCKLTEIYDEQFNQTIQARSLTDHVPVCLIEMTSSNTDNESLMGLVGMMVPVLLSIDFLNMNVYWKPISREEYQDYVMLIPN